MKHHALRVCAPLLMVKFIVARCYQFAGGGAVAGATAVASPSRWRASGILPCLQEFHVLDDRPALLLVQLARMAAHGHVLPQVSGGTSYPPAGRPS